MLTSYCRHKAIRTDSIILLAGYELADLAAIHVHHRAAERAGYRAREVRCARANAARGRGGTSNAYIAAYIGEQPAHSPVDFALHSPHRVLKALAYTESHVLADFVGEQLRGRGNTQEPFDLADNAIEPACNFAY